MDIKLAPSNPIDLSPLDHSATSFDWYLIQCKAKEGFRAYEQLTNQGFHCFHPTHHVKRSAGPGRPRKIVQESLFPYYLFIQADLQQSFGSVRSTRGVLKIVGFGNTPLKVSSQLVSALQQHCQMLSDHDAHDLAIGPQPGDKVTINQGCFKDLQAVVKAQQGKDRVLLLLNFLNQQQSLSLPLHYIE